MSTKKPQRKPTLRDFIAEMFQAGRLPMTTATRSCYVDLANRVRDAVAREPLVADLTPEGFERFNAYINERYRPKTRESLRAYFRRVWRLAAQLGRVAEGPPTLHWTQRPGRRTRRPQATIAPLAKGERPLTVRQLYHSYYVPLRLRGRSRRSLHQYGVNIDHLHRFLGHDPLLTDLDDEAITAFLHSFIEKGKSPASANKARNHILALWRFGARKRFVEQFPDVPRIHEPARVPKAWSKEELHRLFAAIDETDGEIACVPANRWFRALHEVLWWTAERIGAVLQLRWSDFDSETGFLIVPAEFRKFQTSDKFTELPPEAVNALTAIREPARELIFRLPFCQSTLWNRYKRILRCAGLPTDRKSMFHRMRKSAASHFEAAGGNATELLGHSSRRVTLNYLSPSIVKPQQTSGMLFSPTGPGKDGAA